jgi:hypothetical protein
MDNKNTAAEDQNFACFLHLAALKYLLAGDPQSGELIGFLFERCRAIRWDDPAFIAVSAEMRSGTPWLTPEQVAASKPYLLGVIHTLLEKIAAQDEAATLAIPTVKKAIDDVAQAQSRTECLHEFAVKMLDLHSRMIDRLHELGGDTSEFYPPKLDL